MQGLGVTELAAYEMSGLNGMDESHLSETNIMLCYCRCVLYQYNVLIAFVHFDVELFFLFFFFSLSLIFPAVLREDGVGAPYT